MLAGSVGFPVFLKRDELMWSVMPPRRQGLAAFCLIGSGQEIWAIAADTQFHLNPPLFFHFRLQHRKYKSFSVPPRRINILIVGFFSLLICNCNYNYLVSATRDLCCSDASVLKRTKTDLL